MNNLASAQRAYDAQRPAEYYDDGSEDRARRAASLNVAEQFVRAIQRGNPAERMPTYGTVKSADMATLLTSLSNDAAKLLLAACAQSLKPGASLGTAERFAEDRLVADLLRKFVAEMGTEYAADHLDAWL